MPSGKDNPRELGVDLVRTLILMLVLLMAGARLGFAVRSPAHIAVAAVLAVLLYGAGVLVWRRLR